MKLICIIGVVGDTSSIDSNSILTFDGVDKVLKVQEPFKKANRLFKPEDTVINVNGTYSWRKSLRNYGWTMFC